MPTETFTLALTMEPTTCFKCGIVFGVPEWWKKQRRQDHAEFFCPNGHGQVFLAKSEAELLREQLAEQKRRSEYMEANAKRASDEAARAQAEMAKMKRRTAHGVCPCCGRTFIQLQRHLKTKHPEYVTANGKTATA